MSSTNSFLTESELIGIRDNVKESITSMKKQIIKQKFEMIGKAILSTTMIIGGVAVAIIFPSPIVIAALGGAAALIGGNGGVINGAKKVKNNNINRRVEKEELRLLEKEVTSMRTAREVIDTLASAPTQDAPSAPPRYELYPSKDLW